MCVNNFRVRSITLKPLDIFSRSFTQTSNTIRQCAEHMNRNSGFPTFELLLVFLLLSYCPLCVNNFRVRSITLKPLDIFSRSFTQTSNTIRQCAEHMNRNSGFPTFELLLVFLLLSYCPLCVNNFRVRSITLKPLDIFS